MECLELLLFRRRLNACERLDAVDHVFLGDFATSDGLCDAWVFFQVSFVSGIPADVLREDDVEKLIDLFIGEFVRVPHHFECGFHRALDADTCIVGGLFLF